MNGISKTKSELEAYILQFKTMIKNPETQGVILVLSENNFLPLKQYLRALVASRFQFMQQPENIQLVTGRTRGFAPV